MGIPNSFMVYVMGNATKMDENWGYPYFRNPSYGTNMMIPVSLFFMAIEPSRSVNLGYHLCDVDIEQNGKNDDRPAEYGFHMI